MQKYSYEFKKKLVAEYFNGDVGYDAITKKYGLGSTSILRRWISAYKALGDEGLKCSRGKKKYSFEFKMNVVQLYLTTEVSYQELAMQIGMNNPNLICTWVCNYQAAGADALHPKKKGRKPQVLNLKEQTSNTEKKKTDSEYLRQLEDENLRLRIENAYLKELRRLRLEDEERKGKRVPFTVSEENSD